MRVDRGDQMNRNLVVATAAALAIGVGGGYFASELSAGRGPASASADSPREFVWNLFGRPRDADAARPGQRRPEGFAVWRTRVDTSRPEPAQCVEMSRPLDRARSYEDFVLVSPAPERPPAVTVSGSELCVSGLGFAERRITLLRGLPAAGGATLAANADVDFASAARPPYVGFAGQGVILPRTESDGLGIETLNVSRVHVEVWRVPDRNLVRKAIQASDPTAEGEYSSEYDENSPQNAGRRIWSGEIPVQANGRERVTTVFPLGAVLRDVRPGAYWVKVRDASGGRRPPADDEYEENPPAQAHRWVIFTDMALTAYRGSDALDVVVRSLNSARPMNDVRVALVGQDGADLATAQTDGSGRVRFARALLQGTAGAAPKAIMAYGPNADFTTLDLERSPVDLTGGRSAANAEPGRTVTGDIDAFLYADRGIYRPGEQVHLVALLRDQQARAIRDRRGAIVFRRPSGVEAFRFQFPGAPTGAVTADATLPRSAPRGRWRATVEVEGVEEPVGELTFSVEDFAPQRLAVTAAADEQRPVSGTEVRNIAVLARFLYGAPGAGLQTQFEARVRADPNPFPALEGFRWGDEVAAFEERFVEFNPTVTDGEGRASASFDATGYAAANAPLIAATTASVFEPGGRPVREGVELKLRPRPLYLGARFEPGTAEGGLSSEPPMTIQIAAVDPSGRRVAAPNVAYQLIRENWQYDWYQQDGQWRWRRTQQDVVVARGALNVAADGSARLNRRLGWGDYRLVLDDPASGAHTALRFASGWSTPSQDVEAPDFVRVTAGTRQYALGDTVEVTIAPPYAGEAQIAVATDRLIDYQTVSVGPNGRTIRLRTDANWGGGAYVLVSVIQPRDPAATPRPRRALGLVYVPLQPRGRTLAVNLGTPQQMRGREQLRVPVAVQGLRAGQRARVTVAAVDEGILRLTRFANPDPVNWYFGRRALSLDYLDDYGRLLDPNLGAPAQLNYGGDEIGGEGLTVTPIRTVALWSGVVETGLDGRATVTLPAPDFNGEVRLMAVAWTDEQVGGGTSRVTVREPVVAELNLPRFLAPGDRAQATLELHNVEGRPGAYTAAVSAVRNVVASFRQVFDLLLGQRLTAPVEVGGAPMAGVGQVAFSVTGPNFSQTRQIPIQTRLGWGPVTRAYVDLQQPNTTFALPPEVVQGLAAGTLAVEVSYSPIRGFDPGPVAAALSRYPYGCSEQLASIAYPLLYSPRVAQGQGPRQAPALVSQTVGRLLDRQSVDGAFGLWSAGDGAADAWLGAYLTDFLVEARAQGAYIPPEAYDRALSAMTAISRPDGTTSVSYVTQYPTAWATNEAEARAATERLRGRASAYALYVLAKSGRGDLARLRWWHDVRMRDEPSPLARAHVAAGLALLGDRARSRSAFRQATAALGYRDNRGWYQSPLRDLAGVTSLAYEVGERGIAGELSRRLEGSVGRPDTLNTQEQAFLLQAAQRMLAAAGTVNIQAQGATRMPGAGLRWFVPNLQAARFTNSGSGPLWRTVTVRGVPVAAPGAESSGVSLDKTLFRMDGSRADPTELTQGERVVVRLSGSTDQARTVPMILDDALPAGWEIETVLGPEDGARENGAGAFGFLGRISTPRVQEQRDDRYVASVEVPQGQSFTVAYVARAVTAGDFLLPGAEARDLYRPTVVGRTDANRLIVRRPGPVAAAPPPGAARPPDATFDG